MILAQEQGAIMRETGKEKGLGAEFGFGTMEGTLVLTNKRLLFACTNTREEDVPDPTGLNPYDKAMLFYSEVEDLAQVSTSAPNVFVSLEAVTKAAGHKGELSRPSLEVEWQDDTGRHTRIFTETLTGRKSRNINDWAPVIMNLKAGTQKLVSVPPAPPLDTLEGKIIEVLSDLQEKGALTIEEAVETQYKLDLDPDDVQAACERLVAEGLLARNPELTGDAFYRKVSPLG
jgi:hypothetical protein